MTIWAPYTLWGPIDDHIYGLTRLFSLAGRAFDDQRQCMKEEMLEMLMWARVNREKRWENRA